MEARGFSRVVLSFLGVSMGLRNSFGFNFREGGVTELDRSCFGPVSSEIGFMDCSGLSECCRKLVARGGDSLIL